MAVRLGCRRFPDPRRREHAAVGEHTGVLCRQDRTSAWYGAILRTGSLAIESEERNAPSLNVLVKRSRPTEITAIVAIMVGARNLLLWHQGSGSR